MASKPSFRIGILSSPVAGHVYALSALGRALKRRGHQLFFFSLPDAAGLVAAEGMPPVIFGERDFPAGSWENNWSSISRSSGWRAGGQTLLLHRRIARAAKRDLPRLLRGLDLSALLVDENQIYGRTLAEGAGIPFASVAGTVPLHRTRDGTRPPPIFSWRPGSGSGLLRWRNRAGFWAMDLLALVVSGISTFPTTIETSLSRELRLFPLTESFDWGGEVGPGKYVGHFLDRDRKETEFPFEWLPADLPVLFASLGTIHNGQGDMYERIAESVRGLPVTLVVSEGKWREKKPVFRQSGNVIFASYVPQLALLERASAVITHGGVHSVTESLYFGRPMLVFPMANDQRGLATRVEVAGCGFSLAGSKWPVSTARLAILKLLSEPGFARNALAVSEKIKAGGGPETAAGLVEEWLIRRPS